MTTVVPAWLDYVKKVDELDSLFIAAVAHAGDANFNAGTWFANGGSQDDYLYVALRTTGEGGNQNNNTENLGDRVPWWLNANKNGINYIVYDKIGKWAVSWVPGLYSISNATTEAGLQSELQKSHIRKLASGENISAQGLTNAKKAPESITNAVENFAYIDLAFVETALFLPAPRTLWNKLTFSTPTTPKTGKITIEAGATIDQAEMLAAEVFSKNGFDVTKRVTASQQRIHGVQTSDFIVETFGKVELYSPRSVNFTEKEITNITREIVKKKGQANIVAVQLNTDSVAIRQGIANRVFNKPEADSITRILFIIDDKIFSYTRLK